MLELPHDDVHLVLDLQLQLLQFLPLPLLLAGQVVDAVELPDLDVEFAVFLGQAAELGAFLLEPSKQLCFRIAHPRPPSRSIGPLRATSGRSRAHESAMDANVPSGSRQNTRHGGAGPPVFGKGIIIPVEPPRLLGLEDIRAALRRQGQNPVVPSGAQSRTAPFLRAGTAALRASPRGVPARRLDKPLSGQVVYVQGAGCPRVGSRAV